MSESKPFLVFGASGTQGGAVLRRLIELGEPVRAAVSSESSAQKLRSEGIETVVAPLGDVEAVERAFVGVERAYLVLPVTAGYASGGFLTTLLAGAAAENLNFLVFEPRGSYPDEPTDVGMLEMTREFTSKVLNSPVPAAVIRSTVYVDNVLGPWSLPMIAQGKLGYPIPEGFRPGWVSADNTAKVAAALLQRADAAGQIIDVVSPGNPTTEEFAAAVGAAAGHPVEFISLPIEDFARGLAEAFGDPDVATEIGKLYHYLAAHPESYGRASDISGLGVALETVEDWAKRQTWR